MLRYKIEQCRKNPRGTSNSKPPHIWGKTSSRPWPTTLNRPKSWKVNKKDNNKRLKTIKTGYSIPSCYPLSPSLLLHSPVGSSYIARAFPVTCFTRLLTSVRNVLAPAPQLPIVSNPIGRTINRSARASYLRCFRCIAAAFQVVISWHVQILRFSWARDALHMIFE